MNRDWYSDEALAKQDEWARLKAAGEEFPLRLMSGIMEPRVHAKREECCNHCGCDARPEVGGDLQHCSIHLGRGYDETCDCTPYEFDR